MLVLGEGEYYYAYYNQRKHSAYDSGGVVNNHHPPPSPSRMASIFTIAVRGHGLFDYSRTRSSFASVALCDSHALRSRSSACLITVARFA